MESTIAVLTEKLDLTSSTSVLFLDISSFKPGKNR